ncbi:T Cell Receptor Alpha Variable 3 [Manis pentadactyla]|nr:T Cell Receptor Alpha Variable 3 [Manis pentadactyla]
MASAHISMLAILFMLGGLRAQLITQPEDQVAVMQGDPLTVKCTYSTPGSPYFFWYVQYPNQGLQFFLKYIAGTISLKATMVFRLNLIQAKPHSP